MALTETETISYTDDTITALNERVQAFEDATTLQEFSDAVEEFKSVAETEIGFLEEVKSAVEEREFLGEWAASIADDLEGSEAPEVDEDDSFAAGLAAAIQFIRDQY